ncbi:hypothetical protein Q5752_004811 [Cryptotrichosporon argae]
MSDQLATAALDGSLFQPRSASPARSASTESAPNTDDELGSDLSRPASPIASRAAPMGHDGAQTGVKGVIADNEAAGRAAAGEERRARVEAARSVEARKMVAQTAGEEDAARRREEREQERAEEEDVRDSRRRQRMAEMRDEGAKRGGLKEVGSEGFVAAVERPGWVVVLIYEPYVSRCQDVLADMLDLSLRLPPVSSLQTPLHLLRARATNLSFSLLSVPASAAAVDDDAPRGEPDPDVLPSVLAYRDGELHKTWIRVDWDLQEDGLEGLLIQAGILSKADRLGAYGDESDDD